MSISFYLIRHRLFSFVSVCMFFFLTSPLLYTPMLLHDHYVELSVHAVHSLHAKLVWLNKPQAIVDLLCASQLTACIIVTWKAIPSLCFPSHVLPLLLNLIYCPDIVWQNSECHLEIISAKRTGCKLHFWDPKVAPLTAFPSVLHLVKKIPQEVKLKFPHDE